MAWRAGPRLALAALPALLAAAAASAQACDRSRFVVALDPGHSLASPGAQSARGVPEVRFNRALAREVQAGLAEAGFDKAYITSDVQAEPALDQRAKLANQRGADLFLSLHHDSVQPRYLLPWVHDGQPRRYSDRFSGYSLFVSAKNADPQGSLRMARLLGSALRQRCLLPTHHHAEPIPGEARALVDAERGIYRFDDLVVLKSTRMPAVLVEAGIIVNRSDETALASPGRQRLLAQAITAAVERFCAKAEPVADAAPPAAPLDCGAAAPAAGR